MTRAATPPSKHWTTLALFAPGLLFVAALLFLPVADMAVISFRREDFGQILPGFTLANYATILGELFYAELFARQPREALGGDPGHLVILLNLALAVIFLAALPTVWRTLDPGLAAFTTLLIVVQSAFTWVSLGRYLLPAVGVYLIAGAILTRSRWSGWPRDTLIVGSTLLLAVLAVLYAHGYWVV